MRIIKICLLHGVSLEGLRKTQHNKVLVSLKHFLRMSSPESDIDHYGIIRDQILFRTSAGYQTATSQVLNIQDFIYIWLPTVGMATPIRCRQRLMTNTSMI